MRLIRVMVCVALAAALPGMKATAQAKIDSVETPGTVYGQSQLPIFSRWFAKLDQRIDVQFKEATVQQAAEALSKAAGITVQVDRSILADRPDLRITVDARHVPLATVLEAIGKEADLEISPGEAAGERHIVQKSVSGGSFRQPATPDRVVLESWPSISINDQRTYTKGPIAPWSDEWARQPFRNGATYSTVMGADGRPKYVPAASPRRGLAYGKVQDAPVALGGAGAKLGVNPPGMAAGPTGVAAPRPGNVNTDQNSIKFNGDLFIGANSAAASGRKTPVGAASSPASALEGARAGRDIPPQAATSQGAYYNEATPSITRLSDTSFVVAEPVHTARGKHGLLLTVYRIENGQLHRVASTYHPRSLSDAGKSQ